MKTALTFGQWNWLPSRGFIAMYRNIHYRQWTNPEREQLKRLVKSALLLSSLFWKELLKSVAFRKLIWAGLTMSDCPPFLGIIANDCISTRKRVTLSGGNCLNHLILNVPVIHLKCPFKIDTTTYPGSACSIALFEVHHSHSLGLNNVCPHRSLQWWWIRKLEAV